MSQQTHDDLEVREHSQLEVMILQMFKAFEASVNDYDTTTFRAFVSRMTFDSGESED